jgi:hypothetical protein
MLIYMFTFTHLPNLAVVSMNVTKKTWEGCYGVFYWQSNLAQLLVLDIIINRLEANTRRAERHC